MTYPLRYIIGKYQIPVDMKPYEEVIREILKTLADKNLALEINTAGLRREIGQTSPTLEYVKLFRELGGELLTFGSDAHRAQALDWMSQSTWQKKPASLTLPFIKRENLVCCA